ncbi:hypothetical protein DV737_g1798, partial [Chaetothyriales sp. CBS 132003]
MLRDRSFRRMLVTVLVVFSLLYLGYLGTSPPDEEPEDTLLPDVNSTEYDHRCHEFPEIEDVQIVVKTATHELHTKLTTQIRTTLQCFPDLLIFSDMDEQLGKFPVYDALSHVNQTLKDTHEDFEYYRIMQLKRLVNTNFTDMEFSNEDRESALKLDKYKLVHMLELAWKMAPLKKWYVFIEADTYLVASNLMLWLEIFHHSKSVYLGAPAYLNGKAFAHGGSGFILSGTALSRFIDGREEFAVQYDRQMVNEGLGDFVLTRALEEKYVTLQPSWPMLQAEKPSTIPFGPGPDNGAVHWCQPVITMHDVSPEDITKLWAYQQSRPDVKQPLLLKEIYENIVGPELTEEKEDWYNLSDDQYLRAPGMEGERQKAAEEMNDADKEAHKSFEACRHACSQDIRCFQFAYTEGSCGFSFSYRLGGPRGEEDGRRWKSGWDFETIHAYEEWNGCFDAEWM